VKEQLEQLALQMHRNGIGYSDAVREFRKAFLRIVLRRQVHDLELDVKALRVAHRRPPMSERIMVAQKKARTAR